MNNNSNRDLKTGRFIKGNQAARRYPIDRNWLLCEYCHQPIENPKLLKKRFCSNKCKCRAWQLKKMRLNAIKQKLGKERANIPKGNISELNTESNKIIEHLRENIP